jgi:hypothetical protein
VETTLQFVPKYLRDKVNKLKKEDGLDATEAYTPKDKKCKT